MNGDSTNFEEPILQIRRQIEEVSAADGDPTRLAELHEKLIKVAHDIYANLTPWQKTLVARHAQRPYTLDFIGALFDEWVEVHGDRNFADDAAIVAGFARFHGQPCAVVGHQKGRNTKEKIFRNFGQPRLTTGLASCCANANKRSARLCAVAPHSASESESSESPAASSVRATSFAKPCGTTARGSIHPPRPVLRPWNASDVTCKMTARMSR